VRVYPKNRQHWWLLAKIYQEYLLDLIYKYHPYYKSGHTITFTHSFQEYLKQTSCKKIEDKDDPQDLFRQYLRSKNKEMVNLLQNVWGAMPDSPEIHNELGFGTLCDLCSEGYLLDDNE
jgi:hypothetical protein